MRLVIARPLDPAQFFQAAIAHATVHGAQAAKLVPDAFRVRVAPIVAEAAGEIENDLDVIANSTRRRYGASYPLHATLARSDRAFALTPACGSGQNHVGQFSSLGVEKVLDQQKLKPA